MARWLVHWINLLGILAVILFAAATSSELPDRIPVHFGMDGQPTRWSAPTFLEWFGLPILTALLAAFIYWMAAVLPRKPHLINMPDKDRFLGLPTERRGVVIARVQQFLYWCTVPTILMLGLVQYSMFRGATRGDTAVEGPLILLVGVLVVPALGLLWLRMVQPEMQRQIREYGGSRRSAGGAV